MSASIDRSAQSSLQNFSGPYLTGVDGSAPLHHEHFRGRMSSHIWIRCHTYPMRGNGTCLEGESCH